MTYIPKIYNFDYLIFAKKFPLFDSRLNQIQRVHLKLIAKQFVQSTIDS